MVVVLLQEPLLSQGDGLLGRPQDLRGPLEVLGGCLGLQLGLNTTQHNTHSQSVTGVAVVFNHLKLLYEDQTNISDFTVDT